MRNSRTKLAVEELASVVLPSGVPFSAASVLPGNVPTISVLDADGALLGTIEAYESTFTGGVNVLVSEVTGDGVPDVITAARAGGGPRVRVFDGASLTPVADFFAFEPTFLGGVNLSVINTEMTAPRIVTTPGVGGGPRVSLFTAAGVQTANIMAADPDDRGGSTTVVSAEPTGRQTLTVAGDGWTVHYHPVAADGPPDSGGVIGQETVATDIWIVCEDEEVDYESTDEGAGPVGDGTGGGGSAADPSGTSPPPTAPPTTPPTSDKLTWDDFRKLDKIPDDEEYKDTLARTNIKLPYESSYKSTTKVAGSACEGFTTTMTTTEVTASFAALFDKEKSFVLNSTLKAPNADAILKHEKLHLRIAEYSAERAKANCPDLNVVGTGKGKTEAEAKDSAKKDMFAKISAKLDPFAKKWFEIEKKMQQKYEDDSRYGQLPSGQEAWDKDWKKECDKIAKDAGWDK